MRICVAILRCATFFLVTYVLYAPFEKPRAPCLACIYAF